MTGKIGGAIVPKKHWLERNLLPPLTEAQKKFLTDVLGIPVFLLDGAEPASGAVGSAPPQPFSPFGAKPFRPSKPDPMRMREDEDDPGTPPPVPRATIEKRLRVFLHDVEAEQKSRTVKIDSRVREAGHALADGLDSADTQMSSLLHDDSRNHDADELAEQMAAVLPDAVPAENYGRFLEKATVGSPSKQKPSVTDRARQAINKGIDTLGQKPQGDGSPVDRAQPPGAQPSVGPVRPDDNIHSTPSIPIPGS